MFVSNTLVNRSNSSETQTVQVRCKPISANSTVCVGDLIALLGCAVAIVLFSIWAIHRLRKRRRAAYEAKRQGTGLDPYHIPSPLDDCLLVKHGVVCPPSKPEKARTTDVFWSPTRDLPEHTFILSPPVAPGTTVHAQRSLHRPPYITWQSQATPSPRSSWARGDVALLRDGVFLGRHEQAYEDIENERPSKPKSSSLRRPTHGVLARY